MVRAADPDAPDPPVLSREMISGPDLGGGFLHQLTRDRTETGVSFTFHAQVGGADAGGPPKGDPVPLGWERSREMCPLGGRICWHRRFDLPDAQTGAVRAAYQRTRFVMELRIAQQYGDERPTGDAALAEVVDRLSGTRANWWAEGSAALRIGGAEAEPAPISLGVLDETGVQEIATALQEYLIEPTAPTRWAGRSTFGARAFVGSPKAGATVEWRVVRPRPGTVPRLARWGTRSVPVVDP